MLQEWKESTLSGWKSHGVKSALSETLKSTRNNGYFKIGKIILDNPHKKMVLDYVAHDGNIVRGNEEWISYRFKRIPTIDLDKFEEMRKIVWKFNR